MAWHSSIEALPPSIRRTMKTTTLVTALAALFVTVRAAVPAPCTTAQLQQAQAVIEQKLIEAKCPEIVYLDGGIPNYKKTAYCSNDDCVAALKKTKKALPKCSYEGASVRKGTNKLLKGCEKGSAGGSDDDDDDGATPPADGEPSVSPSAPPSTAPVSKTPTPSKPPKPSKTPKPSTAPLPKSSNSSEQQEIGKPIGGDSSSDTGSDFGVGTPIATPPAETTAAPTASPKAISTTKTSAATTNVVVTLATVATAVVSTLLA
jgi:hypothetical protein